MEAPQFHGLDEATGVPFVDQDGHRRYLAALPTPKLKAPDAPRLRDVFALIPESQWAEVSRAALDATAGIKDQNGYNSCVPNAGSGAAEKSWLSAGYDYVKFGPAFTYSKINGGRDQGANLDDCLASMMRDGICPASVVDEAPFYPRQLPATAAAEAARYKVDLAVSCEGFDELATGIMLGGIACYAICVGQNFVNLDSNGVAPTYPRSQPNHAQYADGLVHAGGQWCLDDVNSWGKSFGMNGRCRITRAGLGGIATGAYVIFHLARDARSAPLPMEALAQHFASRAPTRGAMVNVPFGDVA